MSLRSLNDVVTPLACLQTVAALIVPNTRITSQSAQVYVNSAQAVYLQTATWPVVLLLEGPQSTARIGYRLWQSKLTAIVAYYDLWTQQSNSLDTIWATLDADLRRMKANLEDNPTLTNAGVRAADSLVHAELSPYEGQALTKDNSPFPVPVCVRTMTLQINLLPYTSVL